MTNIGVPGNSEAHSEAQATGSSKQDTCKEKQANKTKLVGMIATLAESTQYSTIGLNDLDQGAKDYKRTNVSVQMHQTSMNKKPVTKTKNDKSGPAKYNKRDDCK